jgi:hypothetical protein
LYLYSYHHQESVSTFYEEALEFRQFSANKEPHTTWAMLKSIPTLQNLGWLISLTYFRKGQLISKGPFGVSKKKKKKKLLRISALTSEMSSNKKNLIYDYVE